MGFEPAIPSIKRLDAYVLERPAREIGTLISYSLQFVERQAQRGEQIIPDTKMHHVIITIKTGNVVTILTTVMTQTKLRVTFFFRQRPT